MKKFVLIFVVVTITLTESASELPSLVERCYRSDPEVSQCLVKNFENLRKNLKTGIPQLGVPSFNPFVILEAKFDAFNNKFKGILNDLNLYHVNDCDIKGFHLNVQNLKYDLELHCKKVGLDVAYILKGPVVGLNLDAKGFGAVTLHEVTAKINVDLGLTTRNERTYLTVNNSNLDLGIKKFNLDYVKFFGNDDELNESANKILEGNYRLILDEFEPILGSIMSKAVDAIQERLFKKFEYDVLLPERNKKL